MGIPPVKLPCRPLLLPPAPVTIPRMTLHTFLITGCFGALVLGSGVLLAPLLPGKETRIGLAAALALAGVLVGSLALAALFGWHPAQIDILWLALIGGLVVLRWRRRPAGHGAPGLREVAFFALVLGLFVAPVLVLPVPLDTDAQGFGYLALMLRDGGSLTTLAPFHPEIEYLYSPGFLSVAAYLSARLGIALHTVQFAASAVLAVVLIWLLYDLGNELADTLDPPHPSEQVRFPSPTRREGSQTPGQPSTHDPENAAHRTGIALALGSVIGLGLFTAYMDSHFTTVMALVFGLACLIFITRYWRDGRWIDVAAAVVCLAALPLTHPDTTIILVLGYVPWLATMWLAKPRPTPRQWLVIAVVIPLAALLLIVPWLVRLLPLLGSNIASPFEIKPEHWRTLVFMHGGLIVPLALFGAVIALRRRAPLDVLMIGWLVLIVDFSTTGILKHLLPGLLAPLLKYDYPFSIAWHGPIIPYAYLGGTALLWLARRIGWARVRGWSNRLAWPALVLAAVGLVIGVIIAEPLRDWSKGRIGFFGAFASHADVRAMDWLRENTPPDARVLNFPGPQEGDWAPVISERDTVFFRPQPFFRHTAAAEADQTALEGFWRDPADPAWADELARQGVTYVLVPQVVGNPESFQTQWRWRAPFAWQIEAASAIADAPYLEPAADFDGAQVWRVK
jgi:hypothetical protein